MAESVRNQLVHGVLRNFIEKILMGGAQFVNWYIIGSTVATIRLRTDWDVGYFIAISNVFIDGGFVTMI